MNYDIWQLIFLFFLYSIGGWFILTAIRSIQNAKLINVGVLDGPVCPSFGILMTISVWLVGHSGENNIWQFLLCTFIGIAVLSVEQKISSRLVGQSLHGILLHAFRFCKKYAAPVCYLFVGFAVFCVCNLLQPFVIIGVDLISPLILFILDLILIGLFIIDMITSGIILQRFRNNESRIQREVTHGLDDARMNMARRFVHMIYRRLIHAYPEMGESSAAACTDDVEHIGRPGKDRIFSAGLNLTKIFWIFLICALVGDLIETVYCGVVDGRWMSRSSFLYGPLSMVWGGGAALGVIILEPLSKKNDRWVFFGGFFIGGAYEYLCSIFTEIVFGQVFWDYSDFPLNIGGRTNVLFMFFWGVAALVLIKYLYPLLSKYIEKIKPLPGLILTWLLLLLLILDILVTGLALGRYTQRSKHPKAANQLEEYLDMHYPDPFIEKRWQNMHHT